MLGLLGGEVQMLTRDHRLGDRAHQGGEIARIGRLRPPGRSAPDQGLPTVAESGVPGYQTASNAGMLVPARTPARLIALLNREIVQVLNKPNMLFRDGGGQIGSSPEEFRVDQGRNGESGRDQGRGCEAEWRAGQARATHF